MVDTNKVVSLKQNQHLFLVFILFFVNACSFITQVGKDRGVQPRSVDISKIPNAVPKKETRSKYGNPVSYVVFGKRYFVLESADNFVERGIASWYGKKFDGKRTSSGETYDMYAMTAAHKSLPLPTYVRVKNLRNNKTVILKINDRGPFHENRIIDLSHTAAAKLDILKDGTGLVEVRSINLNRFDTNEEKQTQIEDLSLIEPNVSDSYMRSGFYIQVGSYTDKENAVKMHKKLASLSPGLIEISEVLFNGTKNFRVRFGPITNIKLADRVVSDLKDYGIYDHYITLN